MAPWGARFGKKFSTGSIEKTFGTDSVYVLSDYGTGGLDNYVGEPILFMDEFKGDIDYQTFLKLLDVYPNQVHARYSNIYALWDTVHISSIFTPNQIYKILVSDKKRKHDPIDQLYRRIHTIVYHFKTDDEEYKELQIEMKNTLHSSIKKLTLMHLLKILSQKGA